MIFTPYHVALILARKKWETRRPEFDRKGRRRREYEAGRVYAVQPGRAMPAVGHVEITDARRQLVREVSQADAVAEGYESVLEFLGALAAVNHLRSLPPDMPLVAYTLRLVDTVCPACEGDPAWRVDCPVCEGSGWVKVGEEV